MFNNFIRQFHEYRPCKNARPEPTRVKQLSGAPLYGRLLALPTNILFVVKLSVIMLNVAMPNVVVPGDNM